MSSNIFYLKCMTFENIKYHIEVLLAILYMLALVCFYNHNFHQDSIFLELFDLKQYKIGE